MNKAHVLENSVQPLEAMVDGLTTTELVKRYNLKSRSTLTNRMNALGIEATRGTDNRTYYVSMDAVESLDSLNKCLERNGAKLEDCAAKIKNKDLDRLPEMGEQYSLPLALLAIASSLADPLQELQVERERLRTLEEVADKGWLLPTKSLLRLLGIKSVPKLEGSVFEKYGFKFVGVKKKGRREWEITKILSAAILKNAETGF